jgi:formylglycine-generating enzyme required for sulfatase activity
VTGSTTVSPTADWQNGTLTWAAGLDWHNQYSTRMKVKLTADDHYVPPPVEPTGQYLVVDVSAGPDAASYPVTYLEGVPAGGWTDEFKTTKIVLRRIEAGTFTMGSPPGELGHWDGHENQHQVALTQDFYVGVFEVTQRQWELVMGDRPSRFTQGAWEKRPVEQVSYDDIRGASAGAGWPANDSVDATSFLGKLRARTGVTFDLPTEAQWEYACRAGTTTALNSGKNLTNTVQCPNMAEVGRYTFNGGQDYVTDPVGGGTAVVGSYQPNAWGLYDMHGNVWEKCRDWWTGTADFASTPVTDPAGPPAGYEGARVCRGGGCLEVYTSYCRSASRYGYTPERRDGLWGLRLASAVP